MNSIKKITNIVLVVVMVLALAAGAIACGRQTDPDDNPVNVNDGDGQNKPVGGTPNPDSVQKLPSATPRPNQGKDDSGVVLGHAADTVLLKVVVDGTETEFTAADLADMDKATIVDSDGDSANRKAGYVGVSIAALLKKVNASEYESIVFKNTAGETVEINIEGMVSDTSVLATLYGDKPIATEGDLVTFLAVDENGKVIDSKPISVIEVTLAAPEN